GFDARPDAEAGQRIRKVGRELPARRFAENDILVDSILLNRVYVVRVFVDRCRGVEVGTQEPGKLLPGERAPKRGQPSFPSAASAPGAEETRRQLVSLAGFLRDKARCDKETNAFEELPGDGKPRRRIARRLAQLQPLEPL